MTTQVPQEGSDVGVYEVGKRISSISYLESHNMTTEATVTKIMWILGNFDKNFETVKKLFYLVRIKKSYKFIKSHKKLRQFNCLSFLINFIGELCIKINISQVLS